MKTGIAILCVVVLCVVLFISYFSEYKVVNGIVVSGLLLAVSEGEHVKYCKLLKKATKNDTASIRELTLLEFWDGTSYDHGGVIVNLIDAIGEDKFLQSLATINDEEKIMVCSYLRVGLEYGRNPNFGGKELEDAFPKIYRFINRRETAPKAPDTLSVTKYDTLLDIRDGKAYKTTVIGGKRWMAENLNYRPKTGNSWCYCYYAPYCDKYGRLYDWATAKTVCPSGWRLPSNRDWNHLFRTVGGDMVAANKAGKALKSKTGWNDDAGTSGNGTDKYGFSALPGGFRAENIISAGGTRDYFYGAGDDGHRWSDYFYNAGDDGRWWTVTRAGGDAYSQSIFHWRGNVNDIIDDMEKGLSVRCLQNK